MWIYWISSNFEELGTGKVRNLTSWSPVGPKHSMLRVMVSKTLLVEIPLEQIMKKKGFGSQGHVQVAAIARQTRMPGCFPTGWEPLVFRWHVQTIVPAMPGLWAGSNPVQTKKTRRWSDRMKPSLDELFRWFQWVNPYRCISVIFCVLSMPECVWCWSVFFSPGVLHQFGRINGQQSIWNDIAVGLRWFK